MAPLPEQVRIVEVGPRDGLQNEPRTVPTALKVQFIDRLGETGLQAIECTAFVSPKRVPQLADNAQVMAAIRRRAGVSYPVLVPHLRGFEAALAAQAGAVVERGAPLVVLEAMKMEHTISAPAAGTVLAVECAVGDQVREGVELVDFEAAGTERGA